MTPPDNKALAELRKLRSYNVDIQAGRINYRPQDHIDVIDTAIEALTREPSTPSAQAGWFLPAARINDIQQQSVTEQIARCKQAHFTNLDVRINGKNEAYEADWIKHMVPVATPSAQVSGGGEVDVFFAKLRELADHDEADESAGIMGDCWHASTGDLKAAINALSTSQARPDGVACGKCGVRQPFQHSPDCGKPSPTADGGVVATVHGYDSWSQVSVEWHRKDMKPGTKLYTHPTPAPDAVARLVEALRPFADFARRFGPYGRDDSWQLTRNPSGTGNLTMGDVRLARDAFDAYTAAQQESQP